MLQRIQNNEVKFFQDYYAEKGKLPQILRRNLHLSGNPELAKLCFENGKYNDKTKARIMLDCIKLKNQPLCDYFRKYDKQFMDENLPESSEEIDEPSEEIETKDEPSEEIVELETKDEPSEEIDESSEEIVESESEDSEIEEFDNFMPKSVDLKHRLQENLSMQLLHAENLLKKKNYLELRKLIKTFYGYELNRIEERELRAFYPQSRLLLVPLMHNPHASHLCGISGDLQDIKEYLRILNYNKIGQYLHLKTISKDIMEFMVDLHENLYIENDRLQFINS